MKGTIYGEFAVKFRALGIDFGYARKVVPAGEVVFDLPVPLPRAVAVKFERFGVKVNAVIEQVF